MTMIVGSILAACAAHAPPPASVVPVATKAEKDAANQALLACHQRAIKQLDDGVSDATTVGRSVAAQCTDESEALFRVSVQGATVPEYVIAFRRSWGAVTQQMATTTVLSARARSRRPS